MAGELVYTPVNPTFGGNPSNASGLLANANAQNKYTAPVTTTKQTALEKFASQLQNAVLSRLTGTAVNGIFDADGKLLTDKTVTAGNFVISISKDASGNLVMNTTDTSTGQSTKIVVGNVETGATTQ
jgi:curli production assembly/transport component CsgF